MKCVLVDATRIIIFYVGRYVLHVAIALPTIQPSSSCDILFFPSRQRDS